MSGDAYHMTAPSTDGPRRSMLNAMRDAGVNADQIQLHQRAWHLDADGRQE